MQVTDPAKQREIVQRMIDAGESEDHIASVIQHFKDAGPSPVQEPATAKDPKRQEMADSINRIWNWDAAQSNAARAAPSMLSMGAAMATGGASIPVQMAAAGVGGAVGRGVADQASGLTASIGDRLKSAATEGVQQAALQGAGALVGKGIEASRNGLRDAAKSIWLKAAKITDSIAAKSNVAKTSGLPAAKEAIAETVLQNNAGPIGPSSTEKMRDLLVDLDKQLAAIIAPSAKTVSRDALEDVILKKAVEMGEPGSLAEAAILKKMNTAYDIISKLPKQIPVQMAQEKKELIYKAWNYAAGASDPVGAQVDKALGRAYRNAIAVEEPAVGPINAKLSEAIPAASAVEKAASRTANLSPASLGVMLWGLAKNPAVGTMAIVNDPRIGSWSAQKIYNLAQALPKGTLNPSNIVRVLRALSDSTDKDNR